MLIKRGDIFWVDLNPVRGSEQAGRRPVVVIQNNVGNQFSPTVIVAPLTTKAFTKEFPTNVHLPKTISRMKTDSTVLLSQIRTLDKNRLEKKLTSLAPEYLTKINRAIQISLGL